MRYLRGMRNICEGTTEGGGEKRGEVAPESCKSYAYDDGPYKSDARLVKLTCRRRRRKIKTRLATFSPARLHYAIFSATTNSRRTPCMHSAYTRRATRFHAAPECHGVAERQRYSGFRFHYNPLKRTEYADWLISRFDNGTIIHSSVRITYTVSRMMKKGEK